MREHGTAVTVHLPWPAATETEAGPPADPQDGSAGLSTRGENFSLDLVVTDLLMTEMDGEALVRAIRTSAGDRDIPIILATGTVDPPLRQRLLAAGVDAVVPKGLGLLASLVAAAAAVLDKREAQRD